MKKSSLFILKPIARACMMASLALIPAAYADEDKKAEEVRPDPVVRIDPALEKLAKTQESLQVIIIFGAQPQREVARKVRDRFESDIESLAKDVRAIYSNYLPKDSFESQDDEIVHSKLLQQYISDADKKRIKSLNIKREALTKQMRKEIARVSEEAIRSEQGRLVSGLETNGAKVTERLITLNAVAATIPARSLKDIADTKGVAEVVYDQPGKPELNNQASSLGVGSFWSGGYDGGIWDVGVLDSGVLDSHTALSGHTFYENYAVNGNHGTGVACMYASTHATYRGLAFGLNAILVDDAGNTSTSMSGADWMVRSAGDDPEVINYSWGNGNATGSDWHAFSRFVDALVYDYSTSWAKSAGNQGFGTNTMTVPANNYNGLTVANMDDANTISRGDDVITASSSRGPTMFSRKKPDLSAPGNNTMTCNSSGGFSNLGGTSSAAPKVGAGTLLLTDAGNWDPKAIKAVLINTADSWEDNNTQSTADDGAKTGKEWNKTYGWGYLDLWHANYHRNDYFKGSLKPKGQSGSYKLYKGHAYNGDKATLVWERDVNYNNAATPTSYRNLSDLDLRMYNESNNAIVDSDISIRDNVHQVAATASIPSVVKVYAYSSSFDGASTEPYALATEENYSAASGPSFSSALSAPVQVSRNSTFVLTTTVRNVGDLDAHGVAATLKLPSGFSLVSGSVSRNLGSIADGSTRTVSWTIKAPSIWLWVPTSYSFKVSLKSLSYGETFTSVASRSVTVQ